MPRREVRPLTFYIDAWDAFHNDHRDVYKYQKALDAFKAAAKLHPGVKLSGCMTNKTSAHSYMMDDVKRKVTRNG